MMNQKGPKESKWDPDQVKKAGEKMRKKLGLKTLKAMCQECGIDYNDWKNATNGFSGLAAQRVMILLSPPRKAPNSPQKD